MGKESPTCDDLETWAEIEDYPWLEVSNWGRVMAHGELLPVQNDRKGYCWVHDITKLEDGSSVGRLAVHRLVYQCHVKAVHKGARVLHVDGNKLNNRVDNLELVIPKRPFYVKISSKTGVELGRRYFKSLESAKRWCENQMRA